MRVSFDKKLTVWLPTELYDGLEKLMEKTFRTKSDLVREAIRKLLEEKKIRNDGIPPF